MGFDITSALSGAVQGGIAGFASGGPWGAAIGAGAGGLTSGLSGGMAKSDAKKEYKYASALQQQQMDFYERMSNTSYQRQMEDIKKAGLNPTLLYGTGASATGASTAMPSAAGTGIKINRAEQALSAARQIAEIKNIEADTQNKNTNTIHTKQAIEWTPELNKSLIKLQNAQTKKTKEEAKTEVAKQLALQLQSQFQDMENKVRMGVGGINLSQEIEVKKAQLTAELIQAGYDGSTVGATVNKVFQYLGQISPIIGGAMTAGAIRGKPGATHTQTQTINGPLNIVK